MPDPAPILVPLSFVINADYEVVAHPGRIRIGLVASGLPHERVWRFGEDESRLVTTHANQVVEIEIFGVQISEDALHLPEATPLSESTALDVQLEWGRTPTVRTLINGENVLVDLTFAPDSQPTDWRRLGDKGPFIGLDTAGALVSIRAQCPHLRPTRRTLTLPDSYYMSDLSMGLLRLVTGDKRSPSDLERAETVAAARSGAWEYAAVREASESLDGLAMVLTHPDDSLRMVRVERVSEGSLPVEVWDGARTAETQWAPEAPLHFTWPGIARQFIDVRESGDFTCVQFNGLIPNRWFRAGSDGNSPHGCLSIGVGADGELAMLAANLSAYSLRHVEDDFDEWHEFQMGQAERTDSDHQEGTDLLANLDHPVFGASPANAQSENLYVSNESMYSSDSQTIVTIRYQVYYPDDHQVKSLSVSTERVPRGTDLYVGMDLASWVKLGPGSMRTGRTSDGSSIYAHPFFPGLEELQSIVDSAESISIPVDGDPVTFKLIRHESHWAAHAIHNGLLIQIKADCQSPTDVPLQTIQDLQPLKEARDIRHQAEVEMQLEWNGPPPPTWAAKIKVDVQRTVSGLLAAFESGSPQRVLNLLHPDTIEVAGGRTKMHSDLALLLAASPFDGSGYQDDVVVASDRNAAAAVAELDVRDSQQGDDRDEYDDWLEADEDGDEDEDDAAQRWWEVPADKLLNRAGRGAGSSSEFVLELAPSSERWLLKTDPRDVLRQLLGPPETAVLPRPDR